MTEFVLRPATPADLPAITAIYRPAVLTGTASFELEAPDEAEMLRRYKTIVSAGYPYIVAAKGEKIAGYAYVSAFRARPAYRHTVENSIYVSPDCHRRGVGRTLLDHLIELSTSAGYRQMMAGIGDSANAASIELHTRAGFRHAATFRSVGFKHGRWLDLVMMQRTLAAGDTAAPTPIEIS